MSANVAFLMRLARIASEAACDEARSARAAALVHAYETVLYAGLGFSASRRPTARAKEIAKDAFEALRREVLKSEVGAPPASARILAQVRDRIEMSRRALALRVAVDDGEALRTTEVRRSTQRDTAGGWHSDRQPLDALHTDLPDRPAVRASWRAILQSYNLLVDS